MGEVDMIKVCYMYVQICQIETYYSVLLIWTNETIKSCEHKIMIALLYAW